MSKISELFGSMVFNDAVMREKLPKKTYDSLKKTIKSGSNLDSGVANVVANAMKDWAVEKGVTHFTHWFQPMTGITAEKHDSFISPTSDGNVIMELSGKELDFNYEKGFDCFRKGFIFAIQFMTEGMTKFE